MGSHTEDIFNLVDHREASLRQCLGENLHDKPEWNNYFNVIFPVSVHQPMEMTASMEHCFWG